MTSTASAYFGLQEAWENPINRTPRKGIVAPKGHI